MNKQSPRPAKTNTNSLRIDTSRLVIETDRLKLVASTVKDAEFVFKNFTEKVSTYTSPRRQKHVDGVRKWLAQAEIDNKVGKQWQFTIFNKQTGEFIGMSGVHDIDTDTPEFGIWTAEQSWGNGFGREAVLGAAKWARENLQYRYFKYPVAKANLPSRKIAEALGGVIEDEYQKESSSGKMLELVEYRIYPEQKNER